MSLKVILKSRERLFVNGAVIVNGEDRRINLIVANNIPVLREKDILTEESANTPCRKIYLAVQLMYMDRKNLENYHRNYWKLVSDVTRAAPSTGSLIQKISEEILNGEYYQALKQSQRLIHYEEELIHAGQKSH
jgi:flagellar protein FlbT